MKSSKGVGNPDINVNVVNQPNVKLDGVPSVKVEGVVEVAFTNSENRFSHANIDIYFAQRAPADFRLASRCVGTEVVLPAPPSTQFPNAETNPPFNKYVTVCMAAITAQGWEIVSMDLTPAQASQAQAQLLLKKAASAPSGRRAGR